MTCDSCIIAEVIMALTFIQGGVSDPPEMKPHLLERKQKEREFLDQLLSGKIHQDYGIPIPIKADLRKYQQVVTLSPLWSAVSQCGSPCYDSHTC